MRQRALSPTWALHDTGIRHIDGADDYRFNYHPNYFEIIKGGIILYVYIIIFNNDLDNDSDDLDSDDDSNDLDD